MEEIFSLVMQEIKRSGYDGLLPAGMVLTGGSSALPGIRTIASQVVGVPVRIAKPENLVGMADRLDSPAFSTSVGLLRWAVMINEYAPQHEKRSVSMPHGTHMTTGGETNWDKIKNWLKRLLP